MIELVVWLMSVAVSALTLEVSPDTRGEIVNNTWESKVLTADMPAAWKLARKPRPTFYFKVI